MAHSPPQEKIVPLSTYFYSLMAHGKSAECPGLTVINMVQPMRVFETKEAVIKTFQSSGFTPHDLAQWKDADSSEKYAVVISSCEEPSEATNWIPVFTSILNDIGEDVLYEIYLKTTLDSVTQEFEVITSFVATSGIQKQRFDYVMTSFAHFHELLNHNRHSTEARFPLFHPGHTSPIPKGLHRRIVGEVVKGYQSVEEWYCDKVSPLIGEAQAQELMEILNQINEKVGRQ